MELALSSARDRIHGFERAAHRAFECRRVWAGDVVGGGGQTRCDRNRGTAQTRRTAEGRTLLGEGADEFLAKPIDPDELEVRLRVAERILSLESRDPA